MMVYLFDSGIAIAPYGQEIFMDELHWLTIIIILFVIFMAAIYIGTGIYEYFISLFKGIIGAVIV